MPTQRSWEHEGFGELAPWLAAHIKSSQILLNQRVCGGEGLAGMGIPVQGACCSSLGLGVESLVSHGAVAARRVSGWMEVTAEGIGWQPPALDLLPGRKPSLVVSAVV